MKPLFSRFLFHTVITAFLIGAFGCDSAGLIGEIEEPELLLPEHTFFVAQNLNRTRNGEIYRFTVYADRVEQDQVLRFYEGDARIDEEIRSIGTTESGAVLVYTDAHGLWRSTDSGQSFERIETELPLTPVRLYGIGGQTVQAAGYADGSYAVSQSQDEGLTWSTPVALKRWVEQDFHSNDLDASSATVYVIDERGTIWQSEAGWPWQKVSSLPSAMLIEGKEGACSTSVRNYSALSLRGSVIVVGGRLERLTCGSVGTRAFVAISRDGGSSWIAGASPVDPYQEDSPYLTNYFSTVSNLLVEEAGTVLARLGLLNGIMWRFDERSATSTAGHGAFARTSDAWSEVRPRDRRSDAFIGGNGDVWLVRGNLQMAIQPGTASIDSRRMPRGLYYTFDRWETTEVLGLGSPHEVISRYVKDAAYLPTR